MKLILTVLTSLLFLALTTIVKAEDFRSPVSTAESFWKYQCVDTMKYSRDAARSWGDKPDLKDRIRSQFLPIKNMGANCVAIATPYDEEFVPYLKTWIAEARKLGLKVWFRGNWSAWEGWFDRDKNMSRDEHIKQTRNFILKHPELFQDGDSFTACPECEYGAPGNPLVTRDFDGYRRFLIDEHKTVASAFNSIGKNVKTNWNSMNPDVARELITTETLKELDNLITLDIYVKNAKNMADDLSGFTDKFPDAHIMIGEFGAPIPDINGEMNEDQQAQFIGSVFDYLATNPKVIGINYWVGQGGSTQILNDDGSPKKAVSVIKNFFTPVVLSGTVHNALGKPQKDVLVVAENGTLTSTTDGFGKYRFFVPWKEVKIQIADRRFKPYEKRVQISSRGDNNNDIILFPAEENIWYRLLEMLRNFFSANK